MIYVMPVAVAAILLLQWTGVIPLSSVGGPTVIALTFFIAALALGAHEAWSEKRGPLGWILSAVLAVVGAFVAASLAGPAMETLLAQEATGKPLVATAGPAASVAMAGMMILSLLGAWLALWIVKGLR